MNVVHTIADLRAAVGAPNASVLVPTMGNLHDGHLDLVRRACTHGLPVVASIFVNRLQFAPNEDFDRYPRTLSRDVDLLAGAGCDIVFAPDERELYPEPQTFRVVPDPAVADILEGAFRPGFFTGVATVVMKLFQCAQPRVAVFGQKDYQQLMVIRRMARQFALAVEIEGVATARAADGLALSSRNGYLSADERRQATALPHALQGLAEAFTRGGRPVDLLEAEAMRSLAALGWQCDYLTVRRRDDLSTAQPGDAPGTLVALGAARLGSTRLIDNIEF